MNASAQFFISPYHNWLNANYCLASAAPLKLACTNQALIVVEKLQWCPLSGVADVLQGLCLRVGNISLNGSAGVLRTYGLRLACPLLKPFRCLSANAPAKQSYAKAAVYCQVLRWTRLLGYNRIPRIEHLLEDAAFKEPLPHAERINGRRLQLSQASVQIPSLRTLTRTWAPGGHLRKLRL